MDLRCGPGRTEALGTGLSELREEPRHGGRRNEAWETFDEARELGCDGEAGVRVGEAVVEGFPGVVGALRALMDAVHAGRSAGSGGRLKHSRG